MTITSRKPKVEENPKPVERGFIYIQLQDVEPTHEEIERIKKIFEQIRESLNGFYGL